ncbi:hypothetical protein DK847_06785 [Aestuariivirga litoralis]|uniref:DUF3489 domain-containing protein n=1 Tax=Aestuariivirga litoralis TaxID=2650924 RepID=A0A2W2BPL0_9HYPH|nr:DUF3489 domain-containing protein [Aestuariivirga litoralis]PZF78119.1 hypothetical protein DK847_06785 [Aestuariivirga litoralis]
MTKLSDTQSIILSAASQRTDRFALPLPKSLKGGAAHKVVAALVAKGLLKEVRTNRKLNDPVWRETDDGRLVTLVITDAGLAAIGVEPDEPKEHAPEKAAATKPAATKERKPREGTKQQQMIDLLRRPKGATLAEIAEVTAWQQHTIRGAMAGALKKKLGLTITSQKDESRGRVYKIA